MTNLENQFAVELIARQNGTTVAKSLINFTRTTLSSLGYKCGPVEEVEMGDAQLTFTCESNFIDEETGEKISFVVGIDIDRNGYVFTTTDHKNYTVTKSDSGSGPLEIFVESGLFVLQ